MRLILKFGLRPLNVYNTVRYRLLKTVAWQAHSEVFTLSRVYKGFLNCTYCLDVNGNLLKLRDVIIKLTHCFDFMSVSQTLLFHFSVHGGADFCLKRVITYPAILTYVPFRSNS